MSNNELFERCLFKAKEAKKRELEALSEIDRINEANKKVRFSLITDLYNILSPFNGCVLTDNSLLEVNSSNLSLFCIILNTNFQGKVKFLCSFETVVNKETKQINYVYNQSSGFATFTTLEELLEHFKHFIVPLMKV